MPGTAWTLFNTVRPSSSIFAASARMITSYGPVTDSAIVTPAIPPMAFVTLPAFPTSVWIRM